MSSNLPLRLALIACLACAAPAAFAAAAPTAPGPVTVVKAGKLVDVAAGRVRNDQLIVIQDGKIVAVGPAGATTIPAGAAVVDLSDKTVLPGLIDTHTHVTNDPTTPPYYGYGISVPREALKGARFARETRSTPATSSDPASSLRGPHSASPAGIATATCSRPSAPSAAKAWPTARMPSARWCART
jgi:hypothetical protein